jgi:predicted NBD/HSP70 family sugar kinase
VERVLAKSLQTSRDLKRVNRQRLLNLLYFHDPISRQELSKRSGLSSATVTNLVSELLEEAVVIEAGFEESQGGRPPANLMFNPGYGYFLGADVGETHIYIELFDIKLRSIDCVKREVDPNINRPEQIASLISEEVHEILTRTGNPEDRIIGLGVGVPGIVDRVGGVSLFAPNWGWRNVPLLDLLKSHLTMPILVDNGAQAMALAEMWFGAGQGLANLAVLLIGTGVGSGIIAQGALYRGATNSAGEWGHTCIEINGRPCRCGSRGCIEAYAGAPNLIARLRERQPNNPLLHHASQKAIIQAIRDAAVAGDGDARALLSETVQYLGASIGSLINLINPELVVLGVGWCPAR